MKLYNKDNETIQAKATRKPKGTYRPGRSWDWGACYIILDGEKIWCAADTTWGKNQYFEHNNRWYSIPSWNWDAILTTEKRV